MKCPECKGTDFIFFEEVAYINNVTSIEIEANGEWIINLERGEYNHDWFDLPAKLVCMDKKCRHQFTPNRYYTNGI
jgi:hypothetical protein